MIQILLDLDTGDSVTEQYTITVSDGALSDTMTVTITITGANDAPEITSTAVTGANEDVAYSYTTTASDDDSGDTVTPRLYNCAILANVQRGRSYWNANKL